VFRLGADTKENPVWPKLLDLFNLGRAAADGWIARDITGMGACSTIRWSAAEARLGCA
jgi:hypothetical protein